MKRIITLILITTTLLSAVAQSNVRTIRTLNNNWHFINSDVKDAQNPDLSTTDWQEVSVPHDWAIYGPFDKDVDKQVIAITQNNEKVATEKTGRTGALPFIGVGWYSTKVNIPEFDNNKTALLVFDGAMSNAQVYVNGTKVGERPYGYSYFYFDISKYIKPNDDIHIAVRLENTEKSSRWYPGAGLYRKVQIIIKDKVNFEQWGTFITTPFVSNSVAKVNIKSTINGSNVVMHTEIKDANDKVVATYKSSEIFNHEIEQNIAVKNPHLWSVENPYLYTAYTKLVSNNEVLDEQIIKFGIRDIEYKTGEGLILNGKNVKFKGVCLHHDLGPLGAAVNKSALRRQLTILKDMGCNAIRSSHNMPSLEQLELCDEMGFLFLAESFDEWAKAKVKNGYNKYFEEWAEKDVVNLVRATRNHPCIVMWSSGNEVPDQFGSIGVKRAKWLQDIFHREDPTRPVTVGMDQVKATMKSGFGAIVDIPGLNYRVHLYKEAYDKFPQGFILGSETASTVSSRGIYKFPVVQEKGKTYPDYQCSSYDLEACNWSNVPDVDFAAQDDNKWVIGEFVWTGFDYLGEPTPYDMFWPSRSSYFGICDLAGLPKDRYYLYRSRWNTEEETLHILPHWNWTGREGETTPIFVYTNYDSAELFINGKSQGVQTKNKDSLQSRYRLMWMDTKYEPGTIKVVAYNDNGDAVAEKELHTAGKPHSIKLSADREVLNANGKDISFVTATIIDKNGNVCPNANNKLNFSVKGEGSYRAACNGDATSLEIFHKPTMKTFSGKVVILVKSTEEAGDITLTVKGSGLKTAKLELTTK